PSIRSRPPREPSTRIASPCPTSRTDTRGDEEGRAATTLPATATATISPAAAARLARRPVSWAAFGAGFDVGATGGPTARPIDGFTPRRRRHQVTATTQMAATPAAMTSNGGTNVTLANG